MTDALQTNSTLFGQVEPGYAHYRKWAQPAPALVTPHVHLKWYVIHAAAPFITKHNALGCDFYLRIALELYHKRLLPGLRFTEFQRTNTSPTFCVWVLSAVTHEMKAWTRFLSSPRGADDRNGYLADQLTGWV